MNWFKQVTLYILLCISISYLIVPCVGYCQSRRQAQVVAVSPVQNAINVSPSTSISVTFDNGMDPTTINDTTFLALGEQSGLHAGAVTYNNITNTAMLNPANDFITGEVIAIHLTNAIQDTQGVAFSGFIWNFTIAVQSGTGWFKSARQYPAHTSPQGIATAYLNSDSNLDLIVANSGSDDFSILMGSGNGTFLSPINTLTGPQPVAVACGDLDLDSNIDWIISCLGDNQIHSYLNDGNGIGTPAGQFVAGNDPGSLFLADLNGDGYLDIAVANLVSNNMSILIGNGDGTFQSAVNYGVGPSPGCISGGDLDEDGYCDIVIAGTGNNRVFVFLNNGDGTFTASGNVVTGTDPFGITLASLDSLDLYLDLVAANYGSNTISVAQGDGNGGFSASVPYTILDAPRYCVSSDVDNDADIDIIVSNPTLDSVSAVMNDGSSQFSLHNDFHAGDSTMQLCAGDFNDDGAMDIAAVCYTEDSVSILLSASDTIAPFIISTIPDSGDSNVPLNSNIYITFSEGMDTLTMDTSRFYISGNVIPTYNFIISYDTLTFTTVLDPDSLFSIQETITVDVSPTVADTSGNQMGTPYAFYFTTAMTSDTLGPLVVSLNLFPDTSQGAHYCTVTGIISDSTTGMSIVTGAEIFVDSTGPNGSGIPCAPVDSVWDEILEDIIVVTDISSLTLGDHWVYLHGDDGSVWGPFDSLLLVITPDDDTLGPTFSGFLPDSVPDTTAFNISCVISDPSGVYDDATGSAGQGVYLLWDNDGEITVTAYEVQLSQMSGDTFQTDVQIPQQNNNANFVYEVYAYDNDYDFNEPGDRTQGQSGLQTIVVFDRKGPITSSVQIVPPSPPAGVTQVVIYATVSDSTTGLSLIAGAEAFLDSIGANGTGYVTQAMDGVFDEILEDVFDTIPVSGWVAGDTHVFYVHGQDEFANWGYYDSVTVVVSGVGDTIPPEFIVYVNPMPAYIGDPVVITAVPDEPLHADSAVVCTVTTFHNIVYVLTLLSDTAGYSSTLSTIGVSPGDCYVSISGYDLVSNFGVVYDTFTVGRQGDFLPEAQVYAWPNPARDNSVNFHFYVNANADVTVDVFTIGGKKVASLTGTGEGGRPPHQIASNVITWDITTIASDVYLFKLTATSDVDGEEQAVIKKFAIIR